MSSVVQLVTKDEQREVVQKALRDRVYSFLTPLPVHLSNCADPVLMVVRSANTFGTALRMNHVDLYWSRTGDYVKHLFILNEMIKTCCEDAAREKKLLSAFTWFDRFFDIVELMKLELREGH